MVDTVKTQEDDTRSYFTTNESMLQVDAVPPFAGNRANPGSTISIITSPD